MSSLQKLTAKNAKDAKAFISIVCVLCGLCGKKTFLQCSQEWLQNNAKDLWELIKKSSEPYRWLATGGVHIAKKSRQARQLQEAGIPFPREVIELG